MRALSLEFIGRREGISTFKAGPHYVHGTNKTRVVEMLEQRKSAEVFYVSETFSQVTPESAEHGDFSDTGYEDYGSFYTLKELIKRIESDGFEVNLHERGTRIDAYQADFSTVCYRTGTEQRNCLHITGSERNIARLINALRGES